MTTITTRAAKGSPLTNSEIDQNFINLLAAKLELIVNGTTSSATITPACTDSQYNVTALAVNALIDAPSGSYESGQRIILRIKDNGSPRTLTFNAIYRAVGVILPTTTVAGKVLYIGLVYNSVDNKWDVIAVGQEE